MVLVIGRIEFITITANHSFGTRFKMRSKIREIAVNNGVITVVRKKMFLTLCQCCIFFVLLKRMNLPIE